MQLKRLAQAAAALLALTQPTLASEDLWQIYQQATSADPQVLQAAAEKERALEAIGSSRAPLLPQVNLSADYTKNFSDIDAREFNGPSATVGLTQSIYSRNSWVQLSLSEKDAHYADLGYALSLQSLIVRVTNAYFNVLLAKDDVRFAKAELAALERQLEETKQRFEVGLSAITDVLDAQAEYDLSRANQIRIDNNLEAAYQQLRELTGEDHRDILILDTERFDPEQPAPASASAWYEQAQQSSLTLAQATVGVEMAREGIELAKTGHWPTFGFFAQYNYVDRDFDVGGTSKYNDGTVGVELRLPLYSGGGVNAQVRQAQQRYVIASEQQTAANRTVYRSTIDAFNTVNAALSSIRAYEQTVVSRESALQATKAGFEVGTRTIVDVLYATRALFESQRNLANARYSYVQALFNLKAAAGTLSEQDLVEINKVLKPEMADTTS